MNNNGDLPAKPLSSGRLFGMTPFYRRPITLKAVAITLAVPLLGLGVPWLGWQAWNARPLNIAREFNVSTPAVPTPNAHDLYQQAHDEFQVNRNWRDLPSAILDSSNPPKKREYPLSKKISWVARNQHGFELFERGLKADTLFLPIRSAQPDGRIEAPYHLRWLARYVTVEVEALAQQKKYEAAASRALDIWQMDWKPVTARLRLRLSTR